VDVPGVVRSNWIGASGENAPSAGVELGVAGYAALGTVSDDSLAIADSTTMSILLPSSILCYIIISIFSCKP